MSADIITQGTLRTTDGRVLPLERTDVRVNIAGPVADVTVQQRFKNDGATPIEAVYLFPLPDNASVYRMLFRIQDRIVKGVVKEKAEARRAYEKAKSEGRAATLLEEDKPSVFTLSVANIAPGAVIEVELAYQEVVPFDDGRFCFVYPMVAPPRYAPAEPGEQANGPRIPLGDRGADIGLTVHFSATKKLDTVRCPSHRTQTVTELDGTLRITLPDNGPVPNRDFILTWQAAESGVRPTVYFERKANETGTFLLNLTPSAMREEGGGMGQDQMRALRCGNCGGLVTDMTAIRDIPGVGPVVPCKYCGAILAPGTDTVTRSVAPRDVVVLVDRSASMLKSYSQAIRVAVGFLRRLPLGDGVQLFAFDHDRLAFDSVGSGYVANAPEVVERVEAFLKGLEPRGGSELTAALSTAAKLQERQGRTRHVVLITDAAVGNEGLLLRKVPEILGSSTRLFVFGVGASIDRRLVSRLAQVGGGAFDVALPDEDIEATLDRFTRRVREGGPVLRDLSISWEGAAVSLSYPAKLPDLYGGQPIQVLGRFNDVGHARLVITGRTVLDKPFRQELDVNLPAQVNEVPGLARLWARRHVDALAETLRKSPHLTDVKNEAIDLSITHSIVSSFTSLVAEDSQVAVQKIKVKKLVLFVEQGPDKGKTFILDTVRTRLGHHSSCNIVLNDPAVSRAHCELIVDEGAFTLIDAASTNGTTINGQSVRKAKLEAGMAIAMGNTTLKVHEYQGNDAWFEVLPTERVDLAAREEGHSEEEEESPTGVRATQVEKAAPPKPAMEVAMLRSASYSAPARGAAVPLEASEAKTLAHIDALEEESAELDMDESPVAAPRGVSSLEPGIAAGLSPPPPAFGASPMSEGFGPPPPPPPGFGPPPMSGGFGPPPAPGAPGFGPPPMAGGFGPPPAPPAFGPPPSPPMGRIGAPPPPASPPPPPAAARPRGPMSPAPYSPPRSYAAAAFSPPPAPPPPAPWFDRGPPPPPPMPSPYLPPEPPVSPDYSRGQSGQGNVPQIALEVPGSEPYPEQELRFVNLRARGELDLVFLVDATGSMGPYIRETQARLLELIAALQRSPLCKSLRMSVVSYRDHPPQETSYVVDVLELTDNIEWVRQKVESLSARGGGDGPEAVTDGLFRVVRLNYRPGAARAVVWFGDAPPHGVEPEDDGFPTGCPCGDHWFTQAENCREMGIGVYAIGCLPNLRSYKGAEAVYRQVARTTRGMFLALREAHLLVPILLGAALTELDRQRIDEHVADVLKEFAAPLSRTDETERVRFLTEVLRARKVRPRGVNVSTDLTGAAPLVFREISSDDVEGALWRLRTMGRVAA
ncbi:MAG: VWA domain-containing protein [Polyangiaceae bacterium]|nr:VWA domain-containing protein [Polyangiaceae bacterium]